MKAAILNEESVVVNIIEADEAFCEAHHAGRYVALAVEQWCDFGAIYSDGAFQPATA